MGFEEDDRHEPNPTPKLTLSKLPNSKPREPPPHTMQTPPLRPQVSIPFRWEEAPGKPRATADGGATPPSSANKAARSCLDLPPRLLMFPDDAKITVMPSPTTVLDGPYVGRSLSLACTFSFRKGPVVGRKEGLRPTKRRWGSFRDEGKFVRGSLDISRSLGEIFECEKNVKRVGRRRFFNLSSINSNMLGDIYASLKQVVPWRRCR